MKLTVQVSRDQVVKNQPMPETTFVISVGEQSMTIEGSEAFTLSQTISTFAQDLQRPEQLELAITKEITTPKVIKPNSTII